MSRIAGARKWNRPHDISETAMETVKAAQVTCTIYNPVTDTVLETLKALDVREYHLQPSRAVVLKRRTGFLGIGAGIVLEEEPADKILFYVALADAKAAVQAAATLARMDSTSKTAALAAGAIPALVALAAGVGSKAAEVAATALCHLAIRLPRQQRRNSRRWRRLGAGLAAGVGAGLQDAGSRGRFPDLPRDPCLL